MKKIIPALIVISLLTSCANESEPPAKEPNPVASKENLETNEEEDVSSKKMEEENKTSESPANEDKEDDKSTLNLNDFVGEGESTKLVELEYLIGIFNGLPAASLEEGYAEGWTNMAADLGDFPEAPKAVIADDGYILGIGSLELIETEGENKINLKAALINDTDKKREFSPDNSGIYFNMKDGAFIDESKEPEGRLLDPNEIYPFERTYIIDDVTAFDNALLLEFLYSDTDYEEEGGHLGLGLYMDEDYELSIHPITTETPALAFFTDVVYKDD